MEDLLLTYRLLLSFKIMLIQTNIDKYLGIHTDIP